MTDGSETTLAAKAACLSLLLACAAPGAAIAADTATHPLASASPAGGKYIERGRYLVKIGGCNDCHTAGYAQSGGQVPEKEWLLGDRLGWHGPWGTTYAANLRTSLHGMSESDWIKTAQTAKMRPPMPWFALRDMSKEDLRAIYRFVRHLGPAGTAAPAYLPPGQTPPMPFVQFPAPPQ
jgi:mono/diheme cytochrome c family protein